MSNKLAQLRKLTTVVADTGEIDAIKKYQPEDATTNPSLILKAAQIAEYAPLIDQAIATQKLKATTKHNKYKTLVTCWRLTSVKKS